MAVQIIDSIDIGEPGSLPCAMRTPAAVLPLTFFRNVVLVGGLAAALASGCGDSFPAVEDPRWLGTVAGAPKIRRVRDVGTRLPPQSGPLLGESCLLYTSPSPRD